MRSLTRILRCTAGATAIEYALIASLIAVAAIGGMNALGGKLSSVYNNVQGKL